MKEMDSTTEVIELDVGSPGSEEMDTSTIDLKIRTSNPKPFTIESLIGSSKENNLARDLIKNNEDKVREETIRQRDFFYQQHCLASAAGALPGLLL